jgi:hypothetical protein
MAARESDFEAAERLGRRRVRLLWILAVIFIGWQVNFLLAEGNLSRTVDHVKISAWLVWAVGLLLVLATGGGFFRPARVRALMEDELTRANRRLGFTAGFWGAVTAAVLVYILSMLTTVSGREASHIIITAAVGTALLAFGWLERRALKGG